MKKQRADGRKNMNFLTAQGAFGKIHVLFGKSVLQVGSKNIRNCNKEEAATGVGRSIFLRL
jgi:hypothetical protein